MAETDASAVAVPDLEAVPALRATVPPGALSWTPPSDSCLELSGQYAWSVRALGVVGAEEWSDSKLFEVDAGSVVAGIAGALERALGRYLDQRGIRFEPDGGLAALVVEELAGSPSEVRPPTQPTERLVLRGGKRVPASSPIPQGVFSDDVELWLEETGSGNSDYVQLIFATPEFDGDPSDAWGIRVHAFDGGADDGTMSISTPAFTDVVQFFTDGSVVLGELRNGLQLRGRSSPPIACTSFLQEGMLYWDSTINALCACDGSSWPPVDADETGSCS